MKNIGQISLCLKEDGIDDIVIKKIANVMWYEIIDIIGEDERALLRKFLFNDSREIKITINETVMETI